MSVSGARLRLRILLARRRRVVVAALLALAVAAALQALRPPTAPTQHVLVAAHDLPAGHRLTDADLTARPWPRDAAPAGLLTGPQGRVLTGPLRRGEPVTDVRVADGRAGRIPAGWTAVTVRLADPAAALLVAPGDRVQVVAGPSLDPLVDTGDSTRSGGRARAEVIVPDALVLAAPGVAADGPDRPDGTSAGGLLGGFGSRPTGPGAAAAAGLPEGVLALAVSGDAALDLVAVTGIRALTVTRQLFVSS